MNYVFPSGDEKIQCGALKGDSSPMFSPKSSSSSSIYDSDLRLVDTGQALSYRFIRSIGLSDLPIIWFNLYPSRNRSGFLWYPTTWALICRHRASMSSSSWDLPHGLINPLWKQKWVPLLLLLTIALSLCRKTFSSSDHLPSSRHLRHLLMTPSEYLTLFQYFKHQISRSTL